MLYTFKCIFRQIKLILIIYLCNPVYLNYHHLSKQPEELLMIFVIFFFDELFKILSALHSSSKFGLVTYSSPKWTVAAMLDNTGLGFKMKYRFKAMTSKAIYGTKGRAKQY